MSHRICPPKDKMENNMDLFSIEDIINDAPDIVENPCKYKHCNNEISDKVVKWTNGTQYGEAKVCDKCFEHNKQHRSDITYYICGKIMFIEELWFVEEPNE